MNDYAARRAALAARSDADRAAVAEVFGALRGRLSVAETVVSSVRRVHRHRALVGVIAGFAILAPRTTRRWIGRSAWLLPLVIEGMRLARSRRD